LFSAAENCIINFKNNLIRDPSASPMWGLRMTSIFMDNSTLEKLVAEGEEVLAELAENKEIKKARRHPWKSAWFLPMIIFVLVIIVLAFGYLKYWSPLQAIISESTRAKSYFLTAEKSLLAGNFTTAASALEAAQNSLQRVEKNVNSLGLVARFGPLETQRQALKTIAISGQNLSRGLRMVTDLTNDIFAPLMGENSKRFGDLKVAEKREILKKVYEAAPQIQGAKAEVELAELQLEQIDQNGLHPVLKNYVNETIVRLQDVFAMLSQAAALARTAPSLLGYPGVKTYLLLLENYNELRPTGGFIGTVGLLKIKDAEIVSLETRNVYELDVNAEKIAKITPPEPIIKYLNVKGWYLRDANWSPDFPTAVQQIEKFFQREAQLTGSPFSPERIDGVFALTPEVIKDFLKIAGAVEIKGFVFNSDNFTDRLEYLVEVGYEKINADYSTRKNIIGLLGQELIKRFENMRLNEWVGLLGAVQKNLNQKQLLLNFNDSLLQQEVSAQNWAGEMRASQLDFLMFVDANMAALKTDQYVKKSINYELKFNNKNELIAKASITYQNNGTFTWKSTRYRTYTRLYVPMGAELIKASGAMEKDKSVVPGKVAVGQELGKTFFGAFISVEPGQSGTLNFEYKLPEKISAMVLDGYYSLLAQKQAGTLGHALNLNLDFGQKIKKASMAEEKKEWGDNYYRLITDLIKDREVKINF